MTGDIREQVLVVMFGGGRNGKNTIVDTISEAMGDHAGEAPPSLLEHGKSEHPTEEADLCGLRCVVASETESGSRLRVALVKRHTGNARIKARFMRQDYFHFDRTHKITLHTNNKPHVTENTAAVWERILPVPHRVRFVGKNRDKRLPEKLRAEHPGILAWLVRGCLDWQEHGLAIPAVVQEAREDYRTECDELADFCDDRLEFVPTAWTSSAELYGAYLEWCTAKGVREADQLKKNAFGEKLPAGRDVVSKRGTGGVRGWLGVRPK
jgi:putative DNA primase/helicase